MLTRNIVMKTVNPIFKVQPLFNTILENSRNKFLPSQDISFDEAMVSFTGRLSFKQYIKGKPTPWGIKIWCAADSATGYLTNFDVYTGKGKCSKNGLGYDVVMMGHGAPYLGMYHNFFYDKFFSSIKLAEDFDDSNQP